MQTILLLDDKILLNCCTAMNMNMEVVASVWVETIEIPTRGVQIDVGLRVGVNRSVEASRSEMSNGPGGCVIMVVDFVGEVVFVY